MGSTYTLGFSASGGTREVWSLVCSVTDSIGGDETGKRPSLRSIQNEHGRSTKWGRAHHPHMELWAATGSRGAVMLDAKTSGGKSDTTVHVAFCGLRDLFRVNFRTICPVIMWMDVIQFTPPGHLAGMCQGIKPFSGARRISR